MKDRRETEKLGRDKINDKIERGRKRERRKIKKREKRKGKNMKQKENDSIHCLIFQDHFQCLIRRLC